MEYTINHNKQFNSLEVSFNEKPTKEIRDNLKALKYRWNPKKCIWYGYSKEDELIQALSDGLDDNNKIKQIETGGNFFEGYLGARGWEGVNCHKQFELKDVNKYLKQVCKKNYGVDIRTKYNSYSGGESTYITIILNEKSFKTIEEVLELFNNINPQNTDERNYIIQAAFSSEDSSALYSDRWIDNYNRQSIEERNVTVKNWYENIYKYQHQTYVGSSSEALAWFLNDRYKQAVHVVLSTLQSFQYSDSNSMVDYFNTNFYYFVYLKFLNKE